jgi:Rrf2 family protein
MLDVARNGSSGEPVSLAKVAERTDISRAYLEQVALALRAARLLRGVPGRRGGYHLTAAPSEITVGQVLEASIGPICLVDCIEDPALCPRSDSCECRMVYRLINERIADVLRSFTLADLLDPSSVPGLEDLMMAQKDPADPVEGFGCKPGFAPTTKPKH